MRPPFCSWEVIAHREWNDPFGKRHWEGIAVPGDCAHGPHRYHDFEQQLQRLCKDLRLGFDLTTGRYCIFRYTPSPEVLEGEGVSYLHRYPTIIMDLRWTLIQKKKGGGHHAAHYFRDFGDWVLRDLARYGKARLEGRTGWATQEMWRLHNKNETEMRVERERQIEDLVDDAMDFADPGNPGFHRTMVRVPEKVGA